MRLTPAATDVSTRSSVLEALGVETEDATFSWTLANEQWVADVHDLVASLGTKYVFASPTVDTFLQRNSDVAWHLLSAKDALSTAFRAPVEVVLDVTVDPEADERIQTLFGYVRAAGTVNERLDALQRFDTNWFLDTVPRLGGRLNFDLLV
jgi:hypothetical protein